MIFGSSPELNSQKGNQNDSTREHLLKFDDLCWGTTGGQGPSILQSEC